MRGAGDLLPAPSWVCVHHPIQKYQGAELPHVTVYLHYPDSFRLREGREQLPCNFGKNGKACQSVWHSPLWKKTTRFVKTTEGIRILLKSHPQTTVLTITRAGAAKINSVALEALFPYPPLVRLPGDVEPNPSNYEKGERVGARSSTLHRHECGLYKWN
eukprot:1201972-Amphidinium_carterae.1